MDKKQKKILRDVADLLCIYISDDLVLFFSLSMRWFVYKKVFRSEWGVDGNL